MAVNPNTKRQPTAAAKKASKTYNEAPPRVRTQQSTTDDNLVWKRDENGDLTGETAGRAGADSYITRMTEEAKAARTGVRNFDMATTPTNTTLFTGRSVDPATGETVYVDPTTPSQTIERAVLNLISGANGRNSWSAAPGDGFTAQQIPDIYKILQQAGGGKGEYRVSAKGIQTFAPDDPRMLQVGRRMDVPLRTLVNEPNAEAAYWGLNSENGRIPLNADNLPPSPKSVPMFKRIGTRTYQDIDGKMVVEPIPEPPGATPFITPETASQYPNATYSKFANYDGGDIDSSAGVDYHDNKSNFPKAVNQETAFGNTVQGTVNSAMYYRGRDGEVTRIQPDSRVIVPPADGQVYTTDGRALTSQVLATNAQGKAVARTTSNAVGVGGITPEAAQNLGQFGENIHVDADTFKGPAGGRQRMGQQGFPSVAATPLPDGTYDRYINPNALPMGTSVFDVTPGGTPVRSIPRDFTNAGASNSGSTVDQIMNALNADTRSNGDPGFNSKGGGTGRNYEVDEAAGSFGKDRVKAGDIAEEINRQADNYQDSYANSVEETLDMIFGGEDRSMIDGRQRVKALEDIALGGGGYNQNRGVTPASVVGQSGDLLIRNDLSPRFQGRGLGQGVTQANRQGVAQDLANMEVAGRSYYNSGDMEFPDANAASAMVGNTQLRRQNDDVERGKIIARNLIDFQRRRSGTQQYPAPRQGQLPQYGPDQAIPYKVLAQNPLIPEGFLPGLSGGRLVNGAMVTGLRQGSIVDGRQLNVGDLVGAFPTINSPYGVRQGMTGSGATAAAARVYANTPDRIETETPYAFAFKNNLRPGEKISETQNLVPGPQGSLVNEVRPDKAVARQAGNPQTAAAIAALESDFGEVYDLLKGPGVDGYDISSSAGSNSDRQIPMNDPSMGSKILWSPGREKDLGADSKVPPFPEAIELPTTDPQDRVKGMFRTTSTVRVPSSQLVNEGVPAKGIEFVEGGAGGIVSRTEQMYNAQTGEVEGVKQYMMPEDSYMDQFTKIERAADLNKRMLRRVLTDEYDRGTIYLDDDRRPMAPHYDYKGPDGIPLQEKYAAEDRANGLPVRRTAYDTAKRVHEIARPQYGRPFDGNEADPVLSQFSPQVLKQAYATKELNNRLAEATETIYKYHTEFSPTPDQDNLTRTITVQNADGTTSAIKKMMTTEELMNLQRGTRELGVDRITNTYSPQGFKQDRTPAAPTPEPPQFQGGLPDAEDMSYGSPGIDRARQLKTGVVMMDLAPAVQQIPQSRDYVIYDPVEYSQKREQSQWEAEQAQQQVDSSQSFSSKPSGKTPRTAEDMRREAEAEAEAERVALALRKKVAEQVKNRTDATQAARWQNLADSVLEANDQKLGGFRSL